MSKVRIPSYNLKEEIINSVSHGIGAIFSIVVLILCIIKASNVKSIISVIIYGVLMFILYVISCIYHALGRNVSGKKVLRVIDHINVMLMVAGTYMPICLSLLDAKLGWWVFGIVWFITIIAVVFNAIDVDKYTVISVICNLLLGWGVLLLIKPLLNVCSMNGIILLILGGVMYTVGSILYGIGSKIPYMHSVFHFFVLFGSIFHFIFIYGYCI
jgi:hemolysin III